MGDSRREPGDGGVTERAECYDVLGMGKFVCGGRVLRFQSLGLRPPLAPLAGVWFRVRRGRPPISTSWRNALNFLIKQSFRFGTHQFVFADFADTNQCGLRHASPAFD